MQDHSSGEWVQSCEKQALFMILAHVVEMARILLKKQ